MFQLPTIISNILEYSSLFCGVIFILLLLKQKPLAWVFNGVASICMLILFASTKLYFQATLSLYYFSIGCYAYITWTSKNPATSLQISELKLNQHIIFITIGLLLTFLLYYMFLFFNISASVPLIDAFVFAFSIITQYIQAKKILSNFLYWVIIDSVAMSTSIIVGLYYVATLKIFFIICAMVGYLVWRKNYKLKNNLIPQK